MTYASTDDVATRLGRTLTPEETNLVAIRLADVERRIKRRIPDLDDQIIVGGLDVEDVKQVEADTVLRIARNPDGYHSESDGTYSYEFDREIASGRLEISPEDWETLGVRQSSMTVFAPSFGGQQ